MPVARIENPVFVASQLEMGRGILMRKTKHEQGDEGTKERKQKVQSKDMKGIIFPIIAHASYTNAKTEFVGKFVTYFHTKFHIIKSSGPLVIAQQEHYFQSTKEVSHLNLRVLYKSLVLLMVFN